MKTASAAVEEETEENENTESFIRAADNRFDTQMLKKSRIDLSYKSTNYLN